MTLLAFYRDSYGLLAMADGRVLSDSTIVTEHCQKIWRVGDRHVLGMAGDLAAKTYLRDIKEGNVVEQVHALCGESAPDSTVVVASPDKVHAIDLRDGATISPPYPELFVGTGSEIARGYWDHFTDQAPRTRFNALFDAARNRDCSVGYLVSVLEVVA